MALRIRKDGRIFCAALTEAEEGDTYIDDNLHYEMSVEHKVLVTYPMPKHKETGEWFWVGNAPIDLTSSTNALSESEVVMEKNKNKCDQPAVFRYNWAGTEERYCCIDHAKAIRKVAGAIGYPLQLVQVQWTPDLRCSHEKIESDPDA